MFPAIVSEQFIHPFNFYYGHSIREGMSYRSKLYCLGQSFEIAQRPQAFAWACAMSHRGIESVISKSQSCYKVWIDMTAIDRQLPVAPAQKQS